MIVRQLVIKGLRLDLLEKVVRVLFALEATLEIFAKPQSRKMGDLFQRSFFDEEMSRTRYDGHFLRTLKSREGFAVQVENNKVVPPTIKSVGEVTPERDSQARSGRPPRETIAPTVVC